MSNDYVYQPVRRCQSIATGMWGPWWPIATGRGNGFYLTAGAARGVLNKDRVRHMRDRLRLGPERCSPTEFRIRRAPIKWEDEFEDYK